MFNLNNCIEVFGVQVEPQPSVLFATVNKAVEPLCLFTFFDLRYNDISCLVPFWCRLWDWLSHASWDRKLGVKLVQVLSGIRLGTFPLRWNIRVLTDHVLFVFFIGYFLQAVSLQGVVTFSWIVKLRMKSFKSVEDWRPMKAGPGISVTLRKDTLVLSLL